MKPVFSRKYLVSGALTLAATGAFTIALTMVPTPAHALVVFDPSNYAQNLLTAARALNQINNQIQSLQNEANMLMNMAKNLSTIDFPQLEKMRAALAQVNSLIQEAKGLNFRVAEMDREFQKLYPKNYDAAMKGDQHVAAAKDRLDTSMAAQYRADATQQARALQAQAEARAATKQFIGSGTAYTSQ